MSAPPCNILRSRKRPRASSASDSSSEDEDEQEELLQRVTKKRKGTSATTTSATVAPTNALTGVVPSGTDAGLLHASGGGGGGGSSETPTPSVSASVSDASSSAEQAGAALVAGAGDAEAGSGSGSGLADSGSAAVGAAAGADAGSAVRGLEAAPNVPEWSSMSLEAAAETKSLPGNNNKDHDLEWCNVFCQVLSLAAKYQLEALVTACRVQLPMFLSVGMLSRILMLADFLMLPSIKAVCYKYLAEDRKCRVWAWSQQPDYQQLHRDQVAEAFLAVICGCTPEGNVKPGQAEVL